jgi:glycosyltransferase involved in cell wall biosynthesis
MSGLNSTVMIRTARFDSSAKGYGGNIYERMVDRALSGVFAHEVEVRRTRFHGPLRMLELPRALWQWRAFARRRDALLLRSQNVALFDYAARGATIVFHLDATHSAPLIRMFETVMERRFFARRRFDEPIVVIAQYWRDALAARGYRNLHLIYCGFRLADYEVTDADVADFRRRHGLDAARIVYIGNPQRKKGADLAHTALKNAGYALVTSGVGDLELPVRHLDLPFRDYVCLLRSAEVVVTMSRFQEGWNRVAHEAMLVGTPVVGSGRGGMGELLRGGGQLICDDPAHIAEAVERAIGSRSTLGEAGRRFAATFSEERFTREWVALIERLAQGELAPEHVRV